MKTTTINVTLRSGEVVPVKAWSTKVQGLFMTLSQDTGFKYTLSHRKSGKYIIGVETIKLGRLIAKAIAKLADWESDEVELVKRADQELLKQSVLKAVKKVYTSQKKGKQ